MSSSRMSVGELLATASPVSFGPGLGRHPSREHLPARAAAVEEPKFPSLAAALVHWSTTKPDAIAFHFVDINERLVTATYGQLRSVAEQFAAGLRSCRVERGTRVMLSFENGPELLGAFLGCSMLGALPMLAEPPLGMARIRVWQENVARMMSLAEARVLLVPDQLRTSCEPLIEQLAPDTASAASVSILTPSELPNEFPSFDPPAIEKSELAFIQFTSGTTSAPKAVLVSNRAVVANARATALVGQWTQRDLWLSWLPLFHDFGLVGATLMPLLHGIPGAMMVPFAFLFDPKRWLWAIHYFRATISGGPNFSYQLVLRKVAEADTEGLDLSDWRLVKNGAEFIHAQTILDFSERFAKNKLTINATPGYGMAETALVASYRVGPPVIDVIDADLLGTEGRAVPPNEATRAKATFVALGRALPGHEIQIIDENGKPVPERVRGEIVLRGPSLADGYLANPEATARAFRDGWLHSGDLGYMADGELFVCGRAKELIIKAGRNYQPEAFELAAARVEGVRSGGIAALAIPNATAGTEDVVVCVETRLTDAPKVRDLCQRVEQEIIHDVGLRPDRIIALPPQSLPKTTSGKVPHVHLARLVTSGQLDKKELEGSRLYAEMNAGR